MNQHFMSSYKLYIDININSVTSRHWAVELTIQSMCNALKCALIPSAKNTHRECFHQNFDLPSVLLAVRVTLFTFFLPTKNKNCSILWCDTCAKPWLQNTMMKMLPMTRRIKEKSSATPLIEEVNK